MGLAQAVSLPRGGGTLKGQRPLPAAADPPPPSPTPPESRPPHPHREARRRPEPGGGPQGERGAAPEVVLPGGGGTGGTRGTCRGSLAGRKSGCERGLGGWGAPGSVPGAGRGR